MEAIKEKCGKDFPVSVRYSVRSYVKDFNRGALPGEEFEEKGWDLKEGVTVAKRQAKRNGWIKGCIRAASIFHGWGSF